MKKMVFVLIVMIGTGYISSDLSAQQAERYFSGKSLMPVGTYYYPEHWEEDQWNRDLKKMAELGFEFTHFGEFAWARMEPKEGEFHFEWLDKAISLAHKHGLKVILCTPTPTPPAWLTEKYPQVLLKNESGRQQQHGSRLHINGTNKVYRYYAKRILRKLGERYGGDDRVWGWQLDNEPHFGTQHDYSETSQKGFRLWLENEYKSVDSLNEAWGTAFWSQVYSSFNQINIPNPERVPAGVNPHARVDFKRYTATALSNILEYQAEELEKHISDNQFITTNYAYYKFLPSVNPFKNKNDLDFASHTMYLLSTVLNYPEGDLAHRLGSGMELSFSNELAKSVNGYTGIMELQPGQINWGKWNSQPLPGAVRMWVWHSFALNDKFVCTYRFRQPLFGQEQYHNGILRTDGVTVSRGGEEYVQAIREIKSLQKNHDSDLTMPENYASRRTAFLWNQTNLYSLQTNKHNQAWDTWQHYYTYYDNLKTMGVPVTFIQEKETFDPGKYPFLVAPAYQRVNKKLVDRWKQYVQDGGHLILTCRTGQKNQNGHLWEARLQEPIWDLIGGRILYNDQLPEGEEATVTMDGNSYSWKIWGEVIEPESQTDVWAKYGDQFYEGKAGVVHREIGEGTVTFVGAWTDSRNLEKQVLRKVYRKAGADILDLPNYVFTEWRDGFWIAVNYRSESVEAPIHPGSRILIGDETLEPGDVAVWKK
jgi:beta-galactosidase